MQYYFECLDGAKEQRKKTSTWVEEAGLNNDAGDIDNEDEIKDIYAAISGGFEEITDDEIERARVMKTYGRDRLYGTSAIALGYDVGFFKDDDTGIAYTNTA